MQEEGSGCELQSSCTATAPAAKRTRKGQSPETSQLLCAGSNKSSALGFARGQLDVVCDSKREPSPSAMAVKVPAAQAVSMSQASTPLSFPA